MAISLRAARSTIVGDVNLSGDVLVYAGTINTYTLTDYNSFSEYSVAASYGTATISGDTISLDVPNPSTEAEIDLTVIKDGKPAIFNIAVGNPVVNTPRIISPVNNATGTSLQPTIQASAYSTTPLGQGTHLHSQWQVATTPDFLNIAYDSGTDTANKTSITLPIPLQVSTQYYVRVRYTSSLIGTSAWSVANAFTTTAQYVNQPVVSVTDGPSDVGETPTISTSAFSVYAGTDAHSSTDWQILKASDNSVVWQSIGNTTSKVSILVPPDILQVSTDYIARVRHNGATLGSSAWGEYAFTTKDAFFEFTPAFVGQPYGGGYYAGNINISGTAYALIVAPKAQGGEAKLAWKTSTTSTANTSSVNDGAANTAAMIAAGASSHPAANFCNNLTINGYNDWYFPSKDELEICYRAFKPTTDSNSTGSGVNSSAIPPTTNYTSSNPAQTTIAIFKSGGVEAFTTSDYICSTQITSSNAPDQNFSNGDQDNNEGKTEAWYVRAMRKIPI